MLTHLNRGSKEAVLEPGSVPEFVRILILLIINLNGISLYGFFRSIYKNFNLAISSKWESDEFTSRGFEVVNLYSVNYKFTCLPL